MRTNTETFVIRDEQLEFGGERLNGEVILPQVIGIDAFAPTKRHDYYRMKFEVCIPKGLQPHAESDIRWLYESTLRIIMQFPTGTLAPEEATS